MNRYQDAFPAVKSQTSSTPLWVLLSGLCIISFALLLIAAVIVLSLIPVYTSRKTVTVNSQTACNLTCSKSCSTTCLSCNGKYYSLSKNIKIVTARDESPFLSQTGNNLPTGFDVDLMNYISDLYQFSFTYQYTDFAQFIPIVASDINTISISTQTDTLAREQLVNFAQFVRTGTAFLVLSSYSGVINSLTDLCGKKVGVISTSIQENDVTQQNTKCDATKQIQIQSVPSFTDLLGIVQNGTVEVSLYDEAPLTYIVSQSNNQLKVVGQPYNIQPYGILCNKNNPNLCCMLVNAINYLIKQGTYENLLKKYSFTYKNNGVCPSRVNLAGTTCSSTCTPDQTFCQNKLN